MHLREIATSLIGGSLVTLGGMVAQAASTFPEAIGIGIAFTTLLLFTLRSYDKLQTRAAEEASKNSAQQIETIKSQMAAQERLALVITDNTIAKRELLAGFQEVKGILQETLKGNVARDRNNSEAVHHPHPTHLG